MPRILDTHPQVNIIYRVLGTRLEANMTWEKLHNFRLIWSHFHVASLHL